MTTVDIDLLSHADIDEAASLQARAFFDDPAFTWVFDDSDDRRARLPWLMRIGVALGMQNGEVHTTRDVMVGHAVWLLPGKTHVDETRLERAGFIDAEARLGGTAFSRFGMFMDQLGAHHERLAPEPHWYLMILGVDPPHQGRGYGGVLLQPVLRRADRERRRCYLETAKERNLHFYRKHGFEVALEDTVYGGGPRVWMMIREPIR